MNGTENWLTLRELLIQVRRQCVKLAPGIRSGDRQASDLFTGIMQKALPYWRLMIELYWDLGDPGTDMAAKDYGVGAETMREWGVGPALGAMVSRDEAGPGKREGDPDFVKFQAAHTRDRAPVLAHFNADLGESEPLDAIGLRRRFDRVFARMNDAVTAAATLHGATDGGVSTDFVTERRKDGSGSWERRPKRIKDLGDAAAREPVAAALDAVVAEIDTLIRVSG